MDSADGVFSVIKAEVIPVWRNGGKETHGGFNRVFVAI